MEDNDENVLVELDYNNIVLVDPNKVISRDGKISERLVKHENLVMYANLEAELLPRTRLNVSNTGNLSAQKISLGRVNFMKPAKKSFLTNQYTDDFVGGNVDNTVLKDESGIVDDDGEKVYDTELLLINQITIENQFSQTNVTIELEDVRGRALFEKGEDSPYAAFFNYPTPAFYLTIKGYYGKAAKYQLALQKFNARFNTATGNFSITVTFITYKYNILSRIFMNYLFSLPFMYVRDYTISPSSDVNAQASSNTNGSSNKGDVINKTSSYGRQKLHEVYSEYKNKNLLDNSFPELTLQELVTKIDFLETNLTNIFAPADLKPVTDAENFNNLLKTYEQEIYLYQSSSWFDKYMDTKNFLIDKQDRKIYTFKKEVLEGQANSNRDKADSELKDKVIPENNKRLENTETYGKKIPSTVIYETIRLLNTTNQDIDEEKSFFQRTGKKSEQNVDEFNKFKEDTKEILARAAVAEIGGSPKYYWYFFEGTGSFVAAIESMRANLKRESDKYQQELTDKLSSKIQEKEGGLGFKPLLKNFIGVVLANAEAFIRLMCDVHQNAWNKKDEKIRRNAIFDSSKSIKSVDEKESLQKTDSNLIPVYPWPQYFVQNNESNQEPYILAYPGDSRYIDSTKGYLYDVWPEIEFVEEFLKGRTLYGKSKGNMGVLSNAGQVSNRISLNALDFPIRNIIFSNKQTTKFLFEIWERVFLYSNYTRLMRPNSEKEISDLISETEYLNIFNSVDEDSPELLKLLKEISFNSGNFINTLQNISIESWQKYIRDIFVTDYIGQEISNSFSIDETTPLLPEFNYVAPTLTKIDTLKDYLTSQRTNEFNFVDTYPFNGYEDWYKKNMASAAQTLFSDLNNTTKILSVNDKINMIANFTPYTTINENRPVTSFNFNKTEQPDPTGVELKSFYESRNEIVNKNQQPTEGNIFYRNYDGYLNEIQTTSFLNTPYFINAIQEGVENLKSGTTTPFISAAYLFVNSLPLITLKEKYKTDGGSDIDMDYISPTLNKFGAVHKLPYSWVLKYGSIWFRYKTWKETGVDILNNSWKNFDRVKNFDPISSDPNKIYNLTINGSGSTIYLQNSVTSGVDTLSTMNVGFYPKVINDINFFCKGKNMFSSYTDTELQSFLDVTNGYALTYGIPYEENYLNNPNNYTLIRTFSCLINSSGYEQIVVPSFGSNINQVGYECFDNNGILVKPVLSNDSVYNGSVRTFWSLPHYGYFDNSRVTKPEPDEYVKIILPSTTGEEKQEAFSLRSSGYSKIEEIFSVFNKKELDIMESEFLRFCKPKFLYDINNKTLVDFTNVLPNSLPKDPNAIYKNFQNLMTSILTVKKTSSKEFEKFNSEIQYNQFATAMGLIKGFLEYDILMKIGNPSDFDRKLFDSFSSTPPVDAYKFSNYISGSLPDKTNTTLTLNDYITYNQSSWNSLYVNVGFSTIPGIEYTNTGSSITDFFIDMNIEFNSSNIAVLSPLIKIYATQKSKNPNYNSATFISDITKYLNENKKFSDLVFNSLFNQLRRKLPVVSKKDVINNDTAVQGEQVKLNLWETFKSLNDSWIAGYDFSQTTFFEDFLILDRANRNISEFVFFDPFKIKSKVPQQGDDNTGSVINFLMETIRAHNFNVEVMSSYINYYYSDKIDGSKPNTESVFDFGNSLFGTFLNVDTRYSSPKVICTSVEKPSEHLDQDKNPNYRYGNDTFYIERTNASISEDQNNKTDHDRSNKVVAFNVDIGVRNQNIFYNFDVSQDGMKETEGSLINTDDQLNNFNGKKVSTQNYSNWDFYKTRSYSCTVRAMGNALLQPGMYFNLRYVPMFYGPYKITTVKHSITPGLFETTFTGMRQSAYAYETINNMNEYLQLLTRQILNEIKEKTTQNNKTDGTTSKISMQESLTKTELGDAQDSHNCSDLLPTDYKTFIPASQSATTTNVKEVKDNLKKYFPNTDDLSLIQRAISFVTMYISSYDGDKFISFNYNYCGLITGIQKTNTQNAEFKEFGGSLADFIEKKYICRDLKGRAVPTASFENENKMYEFLKAKWGGKVSKPKVGDDINKETLLRYYYLYWNKSLTDSDYKKFKENDTSTYNDLKTKIIKAIELASKDDNLFE